MGLRKGLPQEPAELIRAVVTGWTHPWTWQLAGVLCTYPSFLSTFEHITNLLLS